jgi:GDP-L-fucose synthase
MPDGVNGKRVMVTGGAGFLGARVTDLLERRGAAEVFVPRHRDYELTEPGAVARAFADGRPDTVIHLAAEVGGIGANRDNPGRYFYANMAMGLHIVEEARRQGTEKVVQVGTVCSYPKHTPVPFREEDLWNGYPEETNAPYGIAKKALLAMLQAYRDQYGLNGVYLMPVNLYGPRDNFDLQASHVIPALIRKCEEARIAGASHVECWGTGSASREFLYVDDCADAIVSATQTFDGAEPVNVGSGSEITIRDLTELIARLTGFEGELRWDPSKPDGQPRRKLDTTRAEERFGFESSTSLEDGLTQTIAWFREHAPQPDPAAT